VGLSHHDAFVLLGLLVAVAALLAAAPILRVPYPILLVLGGLAIGFVPGMPDLVLPPELVLVVVLPPLLYAAAFFTSLREVRSNVKQITLLATGLVLATTLTVGVVAHTLVGLPWSAAFVLGAIVSPTDPLAATSIARRVGVPRGIVSIVEGESLINDGTALVAYRVAVIAVVTGGVSLSDAGLRFVASAAGGIAVGLGVGYVVRFARRRLDDPPVEITIALMTGYLAYLPAEMLDVSGVLAAVTVGVYVGWHAPELSSPQQRLQGLAVFEILVFLLNALLFVLIGLQLPIILDRLEETSVLSLLGYATATCLAVIVTRFIWVFATGYIPQALRGRGDPWQYSAAIGWMGMRGAVSLAAALAIPELTDDNAPFPGRDLIIFLTFAVILVTLVFQGLTLPYAIRVLRLEEDDSPAREEAKARLYAAKAALARLDELADEDWARPDTVERMRGLYGFRRDRFRSRLDGTEDTSLDERSVDYQRLRRELLDAERRAVVELRRAGHIDSEIMQRVQRDLDLEDQRLEI
jgi:monovalent cation/hydrogen antiporter